ncbi:hypothetical protein SAMN05660380_00554 [Xylella fastidiosa]|jgi:hypothetical protein|nr:hypothetical protein [Xylella fastidiosa]SHG38600.1 hypothetical protein SAMN05660380_00554 [Xylella fastidiosa]
MVCRFFYVVIERLLAVVLDHPYLSAIYSPALICMELKISCSCAKLGGLGLYMLIAVPIVFESLFNELVVLGCLLLRLFRYLSDLAVLFKIIMETPSWRTKRFRFD